MNRAHHEIVDALYTPLAAAPHLLKHGDRRRDRISGRAFMPGGAEVWLVTPSSANIGQ